MPTAIVNERSDTNLVDRAVTGDKAAFVELIKRHDATARAVAYAVMMNGNAMDDVLQESYLKAYRAITKTRADVNFRAWLCRIVKNTAIDELR